MKKLLVILFIIAFSFASVENSKTVSSSLYCISGCASAYNEVNTKFYFKHVFKVSVPQSTVILYPSNANHDDLPDGSIICPSQVTLHSNIKSYFADSGSWSAKMAVAYDDSGPYEDYRTINRQEFEYSKDKYQDWYYRGNAVGKDNPFPNSPEPVTFSPLKEPPEEYEYKKGFAGGAVKAKNIFSAGGTNEQYFEGDGVKWTTNLGEGTYDLSSQLNIEGVTIGLTRRREGNPPLTTFYSFTDKSGSQFSTSLPKASIRVHVVNANKIDMELVSRSPVDPVPIPTDMTIVVKNTGQVPIKVTSASITQGFRITQISGFNQEIPVNKEHTLKVRLEATQNPPPNSATITLHYKSSGLTCDGTVKEKDLNFAISAGTKKPDLYPKITFAVPFPFYNGDSAGVKIEDCNQFMAAGAHSSSYSIKTNNGANTVEEKTVQVSGLQPGQCEELYNKNVVCDNNIIVTACVDVNNQVDEENEADNCKTETVSCSGEEPGGKNCTLSPSYAMFIPPSSKYFELLCGLVACSSADWKLEDLDKHVSASVNQYGATVYVDAEAPPQKGKLVADAKDAVGEKYTCSSVIDIIESECEDYV